ncbi:hypothetical protein HDU90_001520 [Geranomyces variabilis]|nr:hypothetical protein HDU90_001520 [Geranomyces variabilis]
MPKQNATNGGGKKRFASKPDEVINEWPVRRAKSRPRPQQPPSHAREAQPQPQPEAQEPAAPTPAPSAAATTMAGVATVERLVDEALEDFLAEQMEEGEEEEVPLAQWDTPLRPMPAWQNFTSWEGPGAGSIAPSRGAACPKTC